MIRDRIESALLLVTWRVVFIKSSYLSTKIHHHNYLRMRNTVQTLVADKMYYGFMFHHAKQYKTIHYELIIIHLLPEQT